MSLSALPSADAITGDDAYVDYTGNLAGPEDYLSYLGPRAGSTPGFLAGAEDYPEFLGPQAGRQQGFLADFVEELEGLEGLEDDPLHSAREIGAAANAVFGMFVIPSLLSGQFAPRRPGSVLIGAVAGGLLGYWQPMGVTLLMGALMLRDV